MAENYVVNYSINVNTEAALKALSSFLFFAGTLTKAADTLKAFEASVNKVAASFKKLSKGSLTLKVNTADANKKLNGVIAKIEKIQKLAAKGAVLNISTIATSKAVSGKTGKTLAPKTAPAPLSSASRFSSSVPFVTTPAKTVTAPRSTVTTFSVVQPRTTAAASKPTGAAAGSNTVILPGSPTTGGAKPKGTTKQSAAPRPAAPAAPKDMNWGYKALGPAPLPSNGGMAIDMMKGMGIAYGISGLMTAVSDIVQQATIYDNTIKTVENILKSHDTKSGFQERFQSMTRTVRNVGLETKFTATEVADAAKFLAMAGLDIDAINRSIRPIADIALVGDTDLGTTADVVTNIMTAYEIQPSQMRKIADIMTNTFTMSNTTLTEIAEAYKYSASLLSAGDIGFEEATAAIGVLGDAGIKGSQAGTTMRTIMANILNPTKKQAKAWAKAGVSTKDENGKTKDLLTIFQELNAKELDAGTYYQLFHKTAASGAVALAKHVDKWNNVYLENLVSEGLTANLAYEKKNTLQGLWAQVTSKFTDVGINAFQGIQGQLRAWMREALDWLGSDAAAKTFRDFTNALREFAQEVIDATKFFYRFFTMFGPMIKTWIKFQLVIWPVVKAMQAFRSVWYALSGLKAIGTQIGNASKNMNKLATTTNQAAAATNALNTATARSRWGSIGMVASGMWNGAKIAGSGMWNGTKIAGSGMWANTRASAVNMWNSLRNTGSRAKNGIQGIGPAAQSMMRSSGAALSGMRGKSVSAWNKMLSAGKSLPKLYREALTLPRQYKRWEAAINARRKLIAEQNKFNALIRKRKGVEPGMLPGRDSPVVLKRIEAFNREIARLRKSMPSSLSAIANAYYYRSNPSALFADAWKGTKSSASDLWNKIKTTGSNAGSTMRGWLPVWNKAGGTSSGNSRQGGFYPIWNGTKVAGAGLWNGAKTAGLGLWGGIKALGSGLWNGTKAAGGGLMVIPQKGWAGVKNLWGRGAALRENMLGAAGNVGTMGLGLLGSYAAMQQITKDDANGWDYASGGLFGAAGMSAMVGGVPGLALAALLGTAGVAANIASSYEHWSNLEDAMATFVNKHRMLDGVMLDSSSRTERSLEFVWRKNYDINELIKRRIELSRELYGLESPESTTSKDIDSTLFKEIYNKAIGADAWWNHDPAAQKTANMFNEYGKQFGLSIHYSPTDGWLLNDKRTGKSYKYNNPDGMSTTGAHAVMYDAAAAIEMLQGTYSQKIIDENQKRLAMLLYDKNSDAEDVKGWRNEFIQRYSPAHQQGLIYPNQWNVSATEAQNWTGEDIAKSYLGATILWRRLEEIAKGQEVIYDFKRKVEAGKYEESDIVNALKYGDYGLLSTVLENYNPKNIASWYKSFGFSDGKWHALPGLTASDTMEVAAKSMQSLIDAINKLGMTSDPAAQNLQGYATSLLALAQSFANPPGANWSASYGNKGTEVTYDGKTWAYSDTDGKWYPTKDEKGRSWVGAPLAMTNAEMQAAINGSGSGFGGKNGSGTNTDTGGKGGKGTGGNPGASASDYKNHYKTNTAAPKQVIVRIGSLMSVDKVDLSNPDKAAVIADLKGQLSQALIDVVHDFDETWHS